MQEPLKQKPLSLWEMILGVILYPSEALLEIARQRPWAWAITFIIISVILADGEVPVLRVACDEIAQLGEELQGGSRLFGAHLNTSLS